MHGYNSVIVSPASAHGQSWRKVLQLKAVATLLGAARLVHAQRQRPAVAAECVRGVGPATRVLKDMPRARRC